MKAKTVAETAVILTQVMIPEDTNPAGNVHGGVIMKLIDTAAYVSACRHSRLNAVTASIDKLDLLCPMFVGNLAIFRASVNFAGRTSMEVGVRVEAEDLKTGEIRHAASAYLTFVALNEEGKPSEIPALILESDEDRRRNEEANDRRNKRLCKS